MTRPAMAAYQAGYQRKSAGGRKGGPVPPNRSPVLIGRAREEIRFYWMYRTPVFITAHSLKWSL